MRQRPVLHRGGQSLFPSHGKEVRKADEWRNNVALTFGNGSGTHGERYIIDGGFLELVRMERSAQTTGRYSLRFRNTTPF